MSESDHNGRDPCSGPDDSPIGEDARRVLEFWFGAPGSALDNVDRPEWFRKDPAFDAEIRDAFGGLIEQGLRGELEAWAVSPRGALAEIIVLDQFTRNALRDTPRAFAGDPRALAAAGAMVGTRQDELLPALQRAFVYLPFQHAEGLEKQQESLRLYTKLAAEAPQTATSLDYAQRHLAVIERFGRFPHRNEILGRHSTAEELEFLAQPGSRF